MRITIRTSKWAIWARRLGSFALPLVVLPVFLHREGHIESGPFLVLILFAGLIAALAVLVSLAALARLWVSGDQGWGRALGGLFLGLLCLVPFAYYGALALHYPPATDIATAPREALPLIFEPDTRAMPPARMLTPGAQLDAFPNAETRPYPLDSVQLFALVEALVRDQGWAIRRLSPPRDATEEGRINARILTLPGWREEAVLLVRPMPQGARLDMRSASIGAPLDFGSNGNRISDFMVALDNVVTAFLRDNATGSLSPPEDEAPEVAIGAED